MNSPIVLGILAVMVSAISMGTVGPIARLAETSSANVTFYRLLIGFLFIVLYLIFSNKLHTIKQKPNFNTVITGFFLSTFIVLFTEAVQHTTMLVAVMTLYAAPVWVTILGHFFFNDRLNKRSASSLAVSIVGFLFVMYGSSSQVASNLTGFLYALGSMACYAIFMLMNKHSKAPATSSGLTNTAWQLISGALFLVPLILIQNQAIETYQQWGWMLAAGFVPGFIGLTLAIYAIQRLKSATFSSILYLEPVTAFLLGWLIFDESLNYLQWIGITIIIANSIVEMLNESLKPVQATQAVS